MFRERVAGEIGVFIFFANFKEQIIDRISKTKQPHIRLKNELQPRARRARKILGAQSRLGFSVKGFDVRPFEPHNIQRKILIRPRPLGIFSQPRFEPRAEIAQRKRTRRICDQVGLGHGVEAAFTKHRAQAGKILAEGRKHTKPVLPVIDFEPLERSKLIVRLNEARSVSLHRAAARGAALHAFRRSKRLHHGASHGALKLHQLHTASASAVARKNLLAFSASSCTSWKLGMLSSHSRSVAVWPARCMARSYSFQTGSITGWSCVSRMYLRYLEWPAI